MHYKIHSIAPEEYPEVVELWEASVRATHHFLKEEDIQFFKPLILNEYLKAVHLNAIKNVDGQILGFSGVADGNLEMLFIHPNAFGKGIGKALLLFTIQELGVHKVDVNEDNPEALAFYQHHHFEVVDRSETDATGRPYPLLHMELNRSTF